MATLLSLIYLAYIGLGLPHSLFGALVTLVSAALFPVYLALWLVLFLLSALFFFRKARV